MIELPLIFVAGFLGSSHCVGMCGPFALLLGTTKASWTAGLIRQLIYSAGRVFTYSVLGGVAGFCGLRFARATPQLVNVPAAMSLLAGCFLVYQGLATAGVVRFGKPKNASGPCLAGGLLANFLKSPARADVFLAGLFTGFLPCGLVYGFVGIAASTRDILLGTLTMTAFGLGTIPIMVATGAGGALLTLTARRQLLRVAAWCIVLAGAVSILRGVSFIGLETAGRTATESCPLCP